jgi:hypothetical protein
MTKVDLVYPRETVKAPAKTPVLQRKVFGDDPGLAV